MMLLFLIIYFDFLFYLFPFILELILDYFIFLCSNHLVKDHNKAKEIIDKWFNYFHIIISQLKFLINFYFLFYYLIQKIIFNCMHS